MSYSLSGVLAKCGIRDPGTQPFSANCPLCQTSDGLEVRSTNCVVCRSCDFIGDPYELYAALSKQTLPQALAELSLEGIVDGSTRSLEGYLAERAANTARIQVWRNSQEAVRQGPPAIRATLQGLGCFWHDPQLPRLAKYFGALRGEDLENLQVEDPKNLQKQIGKMGRYTHLCIPCWHESVLTGFWLIQDKVFEQGYHYLPLKHELASLGLGHALSPMDDLCFVVNDPRIAVRFMVRQFPDTPAPAMFITPAPFTRTPAHLFGCRDVLFFPTTSGVEPLAQYVAAARFFTGGAKTVLDSKLRFAPLTQWPAGLASSKGLIRQLSNQALPAYQALGVYLLGKTQGEAARDAAVWSLDLLEQNHVLAFFSGVDAAFLKRSFETETKMQKITFDGQQIIESKDGWTCEGKNVSEAVIRIDEVHTNLDTGTSQITGTVSFLDTATRETKVVTFKDDLAQIERNPGQWLRRFVLTNGGWVDVSPKWAGKLLAIAKRFSASKIAVLATDKPYGWGKDRVLRFNRFLVDQNGVSRAISRVVGPDVPYPTPITAPEADAFLSKEFCMVVLTMLGNLYRTSRGQPGYGVVVPAAPHVVERIAGAFGLGVERNPDLRVLERDALNPLPCFAAWSDDQLADMLRQNIHGHVLCSIDTRTFRLMATQPNWVRLPVDGIVDYQALRWVFYGVAPLLVDGVDLPDDGYFYSNIAKRIQSVVGRLRPQHQMVISASELDHHGILSKGAWGTQTARLLRLLVDIGELPCEATPDGYRLMHADVVKALASPILPTPNIARLTKQLADGKMLADMAPTYWVMNGTMWDLVASNLL